MVNPNIDKVILDGVADIVVTELGNKVLYGVKWLLLLKNDGKDITKYERYIPIREKADKLGFGPDECFRVYETLNGYIMDIDKGIIEVVSNKLIDMEKEMYPETAHLTKDIQTKASNRLTSEKERLANLLLRCAKEKKMEVEVALFSNISSRKMNIECYGTNNQKYLIRYDTFGITVWDIESINRDYLIERGYTISSVQICEILPKKNGVRAKLSISKLF